MTKTEIETFDPASPLGRLQAELRAAAERLEEARRAAGTIGRDLAETEGAWAAASIETTAPATFAEIDARRTLLLRANVAAKHRLGQAETYYKAVETPHRQKMRALLDARDRLQRAERNGGKAAAEAARGVILQLTTPEGERCERYAAG